MQVRIEREAPHGRPVSHTVPRVTPHDGGAIRWSPCDTGPQGFRVTGSYSHEVVPPTAGRSRISAPTSLDKLLAYSYGTSGGDVMWKACASFFILPRPELKIPQSSIIYQDGRNGFLCK